MKKNKGEIMRAQTLIEHDRLSANDDFFEMLKRDLSILFGDYFDFRGEVDVEVCKKQGKNQLIVGINFERLKPFGILPKQL